MSDKWQARSARPAFTLVELLMVITVLAILMMLLLPALSNAKRQARRVVCMSNLRQYGTAFLQYSADHNRQLPLIPRDGGGGSINPLTGAIWLGAGHGGPADVTAYLNFESFKAYTTLPDFAAYEHGKPWYPGGIWYCPDYDLARLQPPPQMPTWSLDAEWQWGRQVNSYFYYARADEIQTHEGLDLNNWANFYNDLVFRDLVADRLLMADGLARWHITLSWFYMHGRYGMASYTDVDPPSLPFDLLGLNQLYGDGRVVWAKPSPAELGAIYSQAPTCGRVGGIDTQFYLRGR
jgi:prepilin-type N-terminal cleavage/methylation domain-containing protein